MKQSTLAEKLHVGPSALSTYETGTRDPSTETLVLLCDVFGVTADYMLGRSENRTGDISDQDAAVIRAYHAAPPTVQTAITVLLSPYIQDTAVKEKKHGVS